MMNPLRWIFVFASSFFSKGCAFRGTRIFTMTTRRMQHSGSILLWAPVTSSSTTSSTTRRATLLFQSTNNDSVPSSSSSSNAPTVIPVIGPLLNTPPLLMGGTLWLDPPTPLQWKTIEVCVEAAAAAAASKKQKKDNGPHHPSHHPMATIDAAPLVAVVQSGSDLASIAAIVGYSNTESSPTATTTSRLDTFDSESLRESLADLSRTPYFSEASRVRLLCIGRAKLSNFRTLDPTTTMWPETELDDPPTRITPDTWGTTGTTTLLRGNASREDVEEHARKKNTVTNEPIVMAQMQLLLDTTLTRGGGGTSSSPVHALSQLSMWSARIRFVHDDRRRLVQWIQAAQTRLNMLSREWQDHDGIGSLFDGSSVTDNNSGALDGRTRIQGFLQEEAEFPSKLNDILAMNTDSTHTIMSPKVLSPHASRLFELDNYGLGSTASAYSDIHCLAKVIMELLQVYYSPERTRTEEFEYTMFSWVALQSVMEYDCQQQDSSSRAALSATNTLDRMEATYHIMMSHVDALRELALAKLEELHDCGEECEL